MGEYLSERVIAALKANDVSKLKKSLRGSLRLLDERGNNLLHLTIELQRFQSTSMMEAFEYLLTLPEINKDLVNMEAHTPLLCVFTHFSRNYQKYAMKLIESGCDLTIYFDYGNTPLHLAVQNNWPETVELLIEKGIDIDIQNENQETALFAAARQTQTVDIMWMLLFYGADPYISRILEVVYSEIDDEFLFTYSTFFDIIHSSQGYRFLGHFPKYQKTFNLSVFVEVMQDMEDAFYKLLDITSDIHYGIDDLNLFLRRVFVFDSKLFKIFFDKFAFIVEEAFQKSKHLDEFFFCYKPTKLQNFSENLFTLLDSDIVSTIVDRLNETELPLLMYLIKSFAIQKDQLELLTQVLCCCLSHGANMTTEAMNELYLSFRYCDLFKIMLHMDITPTKLSSMYRYFWPTVIYSVQMDFEEIFSCADYNDTTFSAYYTTPAMYHLRVPSLAELARYASRTYIKNTYKTKNSRQFYTVLKGLEIANQQKALVSFENKLYKEKKVLNEM